METEKLQIQASPTLQFCLLYLLQNPELPSGGIEKEVILEYHMCSVMVVLSTLESMGYL